MSYYLHCSIHGLSSSGWWYVGRMNKQRLLLQLVLSIRGRNCFPSGCCRLISDTTKYILNWTGRKAVQNPFSPKPHLQYTLFQWVHSVRLFCRGYFGNCDFDFPGIYSGSVVLCGKGKWSTLFPPCAAESLFLWVAQQAGDRISLTRAVLLRLWSQIHGTKTHIWRISSSSHVCHQLLPCR